MLLWICVALIVLGVILYEYSRYCELGIGPLVVGGLGLTVCLIIMGFNFIGVGGRVAALHARHDILVYQYEHEFYENDNDLGKYELVSKIQDWNEDLSRYREIQDDFWIGVFIPNIYDQFDYIELG